MSEKSNIKAGFVDVRVPVSPAKKEKLIEQAKSKGQDLTNYLRPLLYKVADGEIKL